MRARLFVQTTVCFALLLGVIVMAGSVVRHAGHFGLDLTGADPGSLARETHKSLGALEQDLAFTYFVSERERMPSDLKSVEAGVRAILESMRDAAPDRISFRVIDPDIGGAAAVAYASEQRASAFSVRTVVDDTEDEQRVWSSLSIVTGDRRPILIQGIRETDLPYLESEIIERLEARDTPRKPTFAVARSPAFQLLPILLSQHGEVVQFSPDDGESIPEQADALFWMEPRNVTDPVLADLQRFVDSGRSVVLGGASYELAITLRSGTPEFHLRQISEWSRLLAEFGLRSDPDLLMDTTRGFVSMPAAPDARDSRPDGQTPAGTAEARKLESALFLRCTPALYNLKSFRGPARGGLSFIGATPLEPDARLAELGFRAEVVATTSEHSTVLPLPDHPITELDLRGGLPVARQNLMILLHPDDRWRGDVLVLASSSLFRDGIIEQANYAHRVFLSTLARTFGDDDRLVRSRIERLRPRPLPTTRSSTRILWRAFVIAFVPLLLTVALFRRAAAPALQRQGILSWLALSGLAVVLIGLGSQVWSRPLSPWTDVTRARVHTPEPSTRSAASAVDGVEIDYVITPRAAMPSTLRHIESRVTGMLAATGLDPRLIRPSSLTATDEIELAHRDLRPFVVSAVRGDSLASEPVWSALRFTAGDRVEVIPRIDARSVERIEFLITAALERLRTGRTPRIAIVSDVPRLSPAEAYENYQRQGLIAPTGTDVYSRVRSLLTDYGFDVVHVNPRAPALPPDTDLLIWLQPRRDSSAITALVANHLATGGRAIVAVQHFNIQQRQYRGAGFETVYWPQPQFPDLDPYLLLLGVDEVREVLMDRTRSHLELDTQVNRTAQREYDPQRVALPFLIRTVHSNYAPDDMLTHNLGDALFIWGNRFRINAGRVGARGLAVDFPIVTSSVAWSYAWSGGWLPPETFEPQANELLPGPQPLAVRLSGAFPHVRWTRADDGTRELELVENAPRSESGQLLLIGCSEMFKNTYLEAPAFDHDQLLLNAVAGMSLDNDLSSLIAKRNTPHGLAYQSTASKRAWRTAIVWAGPVLLAAVGAARGARRRRGFVPS